MGIAWLLAWPGSLSGSYPTAIRILLLRLKMALALLKLKEHHLWEDIVLRQAGFRDGIWIWETTFGLARKTAALSICEIIERFASVRSFPVLNYFLRLSPFWRNIPC